MIEKIKNLKLRPVDLIILLSIILILSIGILIGLKMNKFSTSPVKKESKIAIQVFIRNAVITQPRNPIVKGSQADVTIRNVPYTKLQVIDSVAIRKSTVIPVPSEGKPATAVDDISMPFQYDIVVTLTDNAKMTDDGFVAGGNKIKIGVPIVLEGFDYKFNGIISAVEMIDENNNVIRPKQDNNASQGVK